MIGIAWYSWYNLQLWVLRSKSSCWRHFQGHLPGLFISAVAVLPQVRSRGPACPTDLLISILLQLWLISNTGGKVEPRAQR